MSHKSVWRDLGITAISFLIHASVYASQASLWVQLNTAGTIVDVVINVMSAICASLANTAFRLKSQAVELGRFFKELLYGLGMGFTAGIIVFAITESARTDKFLQLALVTVAGWGGAKVMEFYTAKFFGSAEDKRGGR